MGIRFGFVSTYPPTQCGLATFTSSLLHAVTASGANDGHVARLLDVVQASDARSVGTPTEVVASIVAGDQPGSVRAADRLNNTDVVVLQHEFGVFGGPDGEDVLPLLAAITAPTIVVLHTVPVTPTDRQRQILEAVVAAADAVVTMTITARDRLDAGYRADMSKVSIIAHGAPDLLVSAGRNPGFRTGRSTILTWGLLGPGKGIEWGIDAMAALTDLDPTPHYVVAGLTHPKVLLRDGEAYRNSLGQQIQRLGLNEAVTIEGGYRDARSLAELVASADVVLLPYDSVDQVTSGVLIEAVAAGKPVVATAFPHARELLAGGAGIVVPHRDPAAIADALRRIVTRRDTAAEMSRVALAAAPGLSWSSVAMQYQQLANRLIRSRAGAAA